MAKTIFTNIKKLVNCRTGNQLLRGDNLAILPCIDNAYLLIEDDKIFEYGSMDDCPTKIDSFEAGVIDVRGQYILPAWCDSHTHLVFAGSRENEFVEKIRGLTYAEIAAKGGGILNSARILSETPEDILYAAASARLKEIALQGTGAVEIKSGYGLTVDAELKMLRVIQRLKNESPMIIRSTFLGAHTYPAAFKDNHEGYINLIINEMLPAIASEKLADYIDVFCEDGFFSPAETERICKAGMSFGLKPKIHANQLNLSGGVETGIKLNAVSVDHLEMMNDSTIEKLSNSDTIGTLLPGAAFFLGMQVKTARQMIRSGCAIAIASDYNPGSSPSGNMNLIVALACIQMKLLPGEAINAATINGAYAMGAEDQAGSITCGKKANFIITKPIPSVSYIPYSFGSNLIDRVFIGGEIVQRIS